MPGIISIRGTRSDRLLQLLSRYERFSVVMHDNPDPDAIATGWGVQSLIHDRLNRPVRMVAGGAIVRAENRHMVELLQPPIELVNEVPACPNTASILVDCAWGTTNQLLTRQAIAPVAVIDHHSHASDSARADFCDIRPNVAASASLAASYLREQALEPGAKLATAMLYAIRTETRGAAVHYSRLDRSIVLWLTERADLELLAEIENAPLSREYFGDLALALQNAFAYDDAVVCFSPRAAGAEIVGEVADLLIRCQGMHRVLCGAIIGNDLLLSARTKGDHDNAVALLQATLEGLGRGGGHTNRAGGKVPEAARSARTAEQLQIELRNRWLAACGVDRQRGSRLVAKREIVENL